MLASRWGRGGALVPLAAFTGTPETGATPQKLGSVAPQKLGQHPRNEGDTPETRVVTIPAPRSDTTLPIVPPGPLKGSCPPTGEPPTEPLLKVVEKPTPTHKPKRLSKTARVAAQIADRTKQLLAQLPIEARPLLGVAADQHLTA